MIGTSEYTKSDQCLVSRVLLCVYKCRQTYLIHLFADG